MKSKTHKPETQSHAPHTVDPVAALQQIARELPEAEPRSATERRDMKSIARRAPASLIDLVLSMAEEAGGHVGGVPVDVTASRHAQANASRLRVGAAAARAIARRLEDEALGLVAGLGQTALSATSSLEAVARTPDGRSLAGKAAELRAAARTANRRRKATRSKEHPATPPAAPTTAAAAE